MIRAKIEDDERNILFKVINGHSTESSNKFTNIENDVKSLEKENDLDISTVSLTLKLT